MPFASGDLRVIESFASQLGLPSRAARDGSFSFVFEGARHVTLTPTTPEEGVVMSVSWIPSRIDATFMKRCLAQAGYDAETGSLVHGGVSGDGSVLLSVRFEPNEISLPVLESCLQDLFARQTRVTG